MQFEFLQFYSFTVLQFLKSKTHIHINGVHGFNSWQMEQYLSPCFTFCFSTNTLFSNK